MFVRHMPVPSLKVATTSIHPFIPVTVTLNGARSTQIQFHDSVLKENVKAN